MRVLFSANTGNSAHGKLVEKFTKIAEKFSMDWNLQDSNKKMRLLLMVSKQGHCLNDLLHRYASGSLPVEIPAVISNHKDMEKMVKWYDIPFYHLPVDSSNKQAQEAKIIELIEKFKIDLTILRVICRCCHLH